VLFFGAKIPQLNVAIVNPEARVIEDGRTEDAVIADGVLEEAVIAGITKAGQNLAWYLLSGLGREAVKDVVFRGNLMIGAQIDLPHPVRLRAGRNVIETRIAGCVRVRVVAGNAGRHRINS